MAGTIDTAITNGLNTVGAGANAYKGTAAQRTAFLSTAVDGMLWQDTDGIKMIWRKDGAAWVPAVWRWSGTTAQMTAFTQAPNGFEWFNTTDNSDYVRLSGAWTRGVSVANTLPAGFTPWSGRINSSSKSGMVATTHIGVTRGTAVAASTLITTLPIKPAGAFSVPAVYFGNGVFGFLDVNANGQVTTMSAGMPASITVILASFSYIADPA